MTADDSLLILKGEVLTFPFVVKCNGTCLYNRLHGSSSRHYDIGSEVRFVTVLVVKGVRDGGVLSEKGQRLQLKDIGSGRKTVGQDVWGPYNRVHPIPNRPCLVLQCKTFRYNVRVK